MTAPLSLLSEAATRLGRDVEAPALSMSGSLEMRRAATAFNEMQDKLRRLIENRTMMLAAISCAVIGFALTSPPEVLVEPSVQGAECEPAVHLLAVLRGIEPRFHLRAVNFGAEGDALAVQ
jgi:hypothetical protein